jgi:hypothetical protein
MKTVFSLGILNAGNVLTLETQLPAESTLIPEVRVFDVAGNLVADGDGDSRDGHFQATLTADGHYFAEISSSYAIYSGHRYQLTEAGGTWEEAEAEAVALGGHLVTIDDANEQTWLRQTFGTQRLWIGIDDYGEEGTWVWADGTAVSYTNWASGEPNNGGNYDGGYMTGSSSSWYDGHYTWSYRGIIELPGQAGDPAAAGPGPAARYLLDIDILDSVPPRIESVTRLPSDGGVTGAALGSWSLTTSEQLDADTPNSSADTYLELRDASGAVLVSDNNQGPDRDAYLSHYVVPGDGTYYARVGKDYYSAATGDYRLRMELARGIDLESDGN